jgi:hypothetical protein
MRRLTFVCLLALPGPAWGQCAGPVCLPTPYVAPVYHAPVVVEKVVVKEVVVPFAVPFAYFAFVAPPTTPPPVLVAAPPAVPAPAAPAHAPAAAPAPCAAVEARLARLEAALRQAPAADAPPVALGEALASAPEAYAPPAPAPRVRTDYPGALGPAVAALAARGCAQCHTGSAARGDVTLWNDRGEWQPSLGWGQIFNAVKTRTARDGSVLPARMPKGQPNGLNVEEVALVRRMAERLEE